MEDSKIKALTKKWYNKLKKLGFEDIENKDGSLKAEVHPRTVSYALKVKDSREAYFAGAQEFLTSHPFGSEQERKIWELHCEGLGARNISYKLEISIYRAEKTLMKFKKMAGILRKK